MSAHPQESPFSGQGTPSLLPTTITQRPDSPSRRSLSSPTRQDESPRRGSQGVSSDPNALPDPEVDITKTVYFMRPATSGGPHIDAIIHNQASTMKILQVSEAFRQYQKLSKEKDIRRMKARNLPSIATKEKEMSMAHKKNVKAVLDDKRCLSAMIGWLRDWTELDPKNQLVKYRSNQNLAPVAKATYTYFKEQLLDFWEMEESEIMDSRTKKLVTNLKAIEDDERDFLKEELHIDVGKALQKADKEAEEDLRGGDDDDDDDDDDDNGHDQDKSSNEGEGNGQSDSDGEDGATRRSTRSRGRGRGQSRFVAPRGRRITRGGKEQAQDDSGVHDTAGGVVGGGRSSRKSEMPKTSAQMKDPQTSMQEKMASSRKGKETKATAGGKRKRAIVMDSSEEEDDM